MCGITGIISNNTIKYILYESLFHIQHRGQDSHGLLTCDNHYIYSIKESGLINNSIKNITILKGNMGIGHVRYKTSGNLTILVFVSVTVKYILLFFLTLEFGFGS